MDDDVDATNSTELISHVLAVREAENQERRGQLKKKKQAFDASREAGPPTREAMSTDTKRGTTARRSNMSTILAEIDPFEIDPFKRNATLLVSGMAVVLAIAATGGANAAKDASQYNVKASDTWAFYQAKSTKQTMYELAATSLEAPPLLISLPTDSLVDCSLSPPPRPQTSLLDETLPEAVRGRQEENLRAFRRKVEAYESSPETGDGESAVWLLGAVGRPRQALLSLPPRRQEGAPGAGARARGDPGRRLGARPVVRSRRGGAPDWHRAYVCGDFDLVHRAHVRLSRHRHRGAPLHCQRVHAHHCCKAALERRVV